MKKFEESVRVADHLFVLLQGCSGRDSIRSRNRVDPEVLEKPEDDPRDHVLGHASQLGRNSGRPVGHVWAVMLRTKSTKEKQFLNVMQFLRPNKF